MYVPKQVLLLGEWKYDQNNLDTKTRTLQENYKSISLKDRCKIPKPHNSKSNLAVYKNNNRL